MKKNKSVILPNKTKIGRIKMPIAKAIGKRCADIYISKNHIKHIELAHANELRNLGIDGLSYVKSIANEFNQIREGSGTSILLIIYRENIHDVAAIDLDFSINKGFWEVKTAQPRSTRDIHRRKILWQNCPSPK
ncbi:MAG: hypothetical protein EOL95_09875 [Bacteroidia bacterium]|nr:hypothetical protein [Bacteroidia bacterium]